LIEGNTEMTNNYKSVWRDGFDSRPRGRSQLWVEGSIPSSLTGMVMVVIKEASVVGVHLLGSSPNHSTERGAHT